MSDEKELIDNLLRAATDPYRGKGASKGRSPYVRKGSPYVRKGFGRRSPKKAKLSPSALLAFRQEHADKYLNSPAIRAKAKAMRKVADAEYKSQLQSIADSRAEFGGINSRIRGLPAGSPRRKAAKAELWGGAPIKDLLHYQRAVLPERIFKQMRVNPQVGVLALANSPGGIKSATRCSAAVEAARRASKRAYNSRLSKWTGSPRQLAAVEKLIAFNKKRRAGRE